MSEIRAVREVIWVTEKQNGKIKKKSKKWDSEVRVNKIGEVREIKAVSDSG